MKTWFYGEGVNGELKRSPDTREYTRVSFLSGLTGTARRWSSATGT